MNKQKKDLRERILSKEHITPSLKELYEKEIKAMLEKKLNKFSGISWLLIAIGGGILAIVFGILAAVGPKGLPPFARVGFGVGTIVSLSWLVIAIKIIKSKKFLLRTDANISAALTWIFCVVLMTIALVAAPKDISGLRMLLSALAFLVMGSVFMIQHKIEQSNLRNKEELLEIKYLLSDYSSGINKGLSESKK